MKIIVKSVYEDVDQKFLDWYLDQIKKAGVPIDYEAARRGETTGFRSKDPISGASATTSYRIEQ